MNLPPPHIRRAIAVQASTTTVSVEKFAKTGGFGMRPVLVERIRSEFERLGLAFPHPPAPEASR